VGRVGLDANLWSDIQTAAACLGATNAVADCLVIPGAVAGTSQGLIVKDTNAHPFGAYNPTGIVVVVGSPSAATFHLDPGSDYFRAGGGFEFGGATNILNKPGLFFYDLAFDAADHTERLISAPKAAVFEFASLGGAASDLWYSTTQMWFDRQADLRDAIQGRSPGGKPGVWLKAVGDWAHRSGHAVFTDFNKTFVFDTSYDQDTGALIGGVDFLSVTNKDQAWVVGIEGGAVDSDVRLKSPDRFRLDGGDIGGYATYLSGPLFVDATINANLLTMHSSLPDVAPQGTPTSGVHTVGGQVEAGYEFPLGAMAFIEPLGSLSYANTSFQDIQVPGGVVDLRHADSFRGSLGGRVGATAAFQYYKVKVAIEGRAWDEWENDTNSTVIVPGGPNFFDTENFKGVFGEVKGEANLFSTVNGFSAFVNGGWRFKSGYSEGTVTLGGRFMW
jgi:outer membrane autotransporter protein